MWTALMLIAGLTTALTQTPSSPPAPPVPQPAESESAEPDVVVREAATKLSDSAARVALATFKRASKAKNANLADRIAAVEVLAKGQHAKLVAPLAGLIASDNKLTVRRAAAKALGHQPASEARKAILNLLKKRRVLDEPNLVSDLVGSLNTAGYRAGDDWEVLESLFESDFGEKHRAKQQQILLLARAHIELESLDMLSRHLDEPSAEDPDAQDNPPAEYWEARWKSWRLWRGDVKAALRDITGQNFGTTLEAQAWIKKNRRKLRARRRARARDKK